MSNCGRGQKQAISLKTAAGQGQRVKWGVGVEKGTSISRMRFSRSMLEGSDPTHALVDSHRRRTADHDGATRPLRSAVLLLPPGRSSSWAHLLRLTEKHISFAFVRERLKQSYSETGRRSIDPELVLRILRIGYLYGVTSERKLVEELRMHLAWVWFT